MDAHKPEFSVVPNPSQIKTTAPEPEPRPIPVTRSYTDPTTGETWIWQFPWPWEGPAIVPRPVLDSLRARFPGRIHIMAGDLSEQERADLLLRYTEYGRGKRQYCPYIDLETGKFHGELRRQDQRRGCGSV